MITVGSLFAGIGGLEIGLERAGMDVRWQVEIDDYCRKVLTKHWPDVKRYEDVREVGSHNLEAVDLICGGFPCQGFSVAGRRLGLADERSGLFWELVRVASELRPAWLVLENVPGLLSSNDGRDMGAVIGGLEDAGYSVAWRVLDSQWFGVAQRRRRVFFVCHSDAHRAGAVLFEPEGSARHPAALRETGTEVAFGLDARSHGVGQAHNTTYISRVLDGKTGGVSGKENQETLVAYTLRNNNRNTSQGPANLVAHPLTAAHRSGEDGYGRGTPIVSVAENQRGELRTSGVSPALSVGGGKPGAGYSAVACPPPDADRVREVAGLPRRLDRRRYKALGNAVTVQVAEWIGRRIVEASERSEAR